jgi:hypothetical protein
LQFRGGMGDFPDRRPKQVPPRSPTVADPTCVHANITSSTAVTSAMAEGAASP